MIGCGPAFAWPRPMHAAFTLCLFTLDRVRTILLALAMIVLMKVVFVLIAPAALGL